MIPADLAPIYKLDLRPVFVDNLGRRSVLVLKYRVLMIDADITKDDLREVVDNLLDKLDEIAPKNEDGGVLFPEPFGDYSKTAPDGFYAWWGHHARYCSHEGDLRQSGVSVAEHGVWCEAQVAGVPASVHDVDTDVYVYLLAPYTHGTYPRLPRLLERRDYVALFASADEQPMAVFTTSAVRSLAAALLQAADEAEFGNLRNGGAGR